MEEFLQQKKEILGDGRCRDPRIFCLILTCISSDDFRIHEIRCAYY